MNLLRQGVVPSYPPACSYPNGLLDYSKATKDLIDETMSSIEYKSEANDLGMYAIVDLRWTKKLARWIGKRKALEVMAGRGWLAQALTYHKANVIATDDYSWHDSKGWKKPVHPVVKMDAVDAVRDLGKDADILIISWPPHSEPYATQACVAWGPGRPIVYIGEGYEGCCADSSFFDGFETISEPNWGLMSWYGIHDFVGIGRWRPADNTP
jgi:hypothetical protein